MVGVEKASGSLRCPFVEFTLRCVRFFGRGVHPELYKILRYAQNDTKSSLRGVQARKQSRRKMELIRLLRFARNDRRGRGRNEGIGKAQRYSGEQVRVTVAFIVNGQPLMTESQ